MRNFQGRRDGNHDDRVQDFIALGCSVAELTNTGLPGWPDLVVGCVGVNHLVEIKDRSTRYGRAGLSESQREFDAAWRGSHVEEVATASDVIEAVSRWRRDASRTVRVGGSHVE